MSEVVLSARDVRKSYHIGGKELPVLQGVNMELHQGEFVALQGASGSGKSTLLQLLGGLDRSSSGSILVDGSPLQIQAPSQSALFRGRHVGFIFQAYHLLPDLVALENVMLPAQIQRLSQSVIENRARDLLDKVGLSERMNHRPSELSGGEQQRVAIARALMNEPEIVLADEPTGNLDSVTELEIIKLLKHLHEENRLTLMVATHDEKVAEVAQRVVCLKDGQVC